jgi:hypothetical protein
MSTTNDYTPTIADMSEMDLLQIWSDSICDPLVTAIRPWSTTVEEPEHGQVVRDDLFEGGTNSGWKTTTFPADAFSGPFRSTLEEPLSVGGHHLELVWFKPCEMAAESMLIRDDEQPGVGIQVSVLSKLIRISKMTGLHTEEDYKPTVGWIIPERVPHTMTAHEFLQEMSILWSQIRKFRNSQVEMTPRVVDQEKRDAWRAKMV